MSRILDWVTTHQILKSEEFVPSRFERMRKKAYAMHIEKGKNNPQVGIGHDVWIGSNVVILPGLKIGDGAVLASDAVISKDVPPYTIVGGVPAKTIRYRFLLKVIKSLLKIKWWDWPIE